MAVHGYVIIEDGGGPKTQNKWPGIGAVDKITAFKPQTIVWKG